MGRLWFIFISCASTISASPYSLSIQRATSYFKKNLNQLEIDTFIDLKRLVRFYDLKIDLRSVEKNIMKKVPQNFGVWMRDLDEKYTPAEIEVRSRSQNEGPLLAAMYCDIYPLPWDFLKNMRSFTERGGFAITRSIFALSIAEWKNCAHDKSAFEREKTHLAREIPGIIQRTSLGTGLWIECILSLYFMDHPDWIPAEFLSALIEKQSPDGSWNKNGRNTALILWILLEADRTHKSKEILRNYLSRRSTHKR